MRHHAKFRGAWSEGSRGAKICHNAKSRRSVEPLLRFDDFSIFFKVAEAAILDF